MTPLAVAAAPGGMLDHRSIGARKAPAAPPQAQAQVDVLAVHVKAFIETLQLGVGAAPQQQDGHAAEAAALPLSPNADVPANIGAARS